MKLSLYYHSQINQEEKKTDLKSFQSVIDMFSEAEKEKNTDTYRYPILSTK